MTRSILSLSLLLVMIACGEPTVSQQSSTSSPNPTASTLSPSPSATATTAPSPTPTGEWKTYSDSDYDFTITYPPDFRVNVINPDPKTFDGLTRIVVFDAPTSLNGQVGLAVAIKDAATPTAWVEKHSSDTSSDPGTYYPCKATNLAATSVDTRPAATFDCHTADGSVAHSTAFFGKTHVIELHWEAHDPAATSAIESIYEQMLNSYRD